MIQHARSFLWTRQGGRSISNSDGERGGAGFHSWTAAIGQFIKVDAFEQQILEIVLVETSAGSISSIRSIQQFPERLLKLKSLWQQQYQKIEPAVVPAQDLLKWF